jgi:hypothetical protein
MTAPLTLAPLVTVQASVSWSMNKTLTLDADSLFVLTMDVRSVVL